MPDRSFLSVFPSSLSYLPLPHDAREDVTMNGGEVGNCGHSGVDGVTTKMLVGLTVSNMSNNNHYMMGTFVLEYIFGKSVLCDCGHQNVGNTDFIQKLHVSPWPHFSLH
ncbi:hypothetical protein MRB53_016782 [Persea americana]|uniref:Uncharacterized protein n=1 Tax=Persea americana TaxID=3435 RepID=A0ACC2M344_PERAE|nr:hypothetical protein MRB53_016782 [Persea americana]